MLNVARHLRSHGYRVAIWAADRGDPDVPGAVGDVPVRYLPCPLPSRSVKGAAHALRAMPPAALAWIRAFRADRPDVIHVHCFGPNGVYAAQLARLTGRPLLLSSHGETFGDADSSFEASALLRAALKSGLRRAGAVTACSAYTADHLAEHYGLVRERAVIVPNGVDEQEPGGEEPPWLPDRFVFAVGRLVHNKGFDLLVRAYAELSSPAVDLVIGGDGPERRRLGELAERLGVRERVHLPGRLPRPQVVTLAARSDAFVVPSRIEAFGITVLEGWRAGVPVIATSRGGPGEFVTDGVTGLVVDPEDTDALASALSQVLQDREGAGRMAAAGRREVRSFTWERVADSYESLYRAVA